MGTRADFYIKSGDALTPNDWLGSIGYDGYPGGAPSGVARAGSEEEFRAAVEEIADTQRSYTDASEGWPWPWEDSLTTDYAYVWDGTRVACYCFGCATDPFGDEATYERERQVGRVDIFPDMRALANVHLGGVKSGLIVISVRTPPPDDEWPDPAPSSILTNGGDA